MPLLSYICFSHWTVFVNPFICTHSVIHERPASAVMEENCHSSEFLPCCSNFHVFMGFPSSTWFLISFFFMLYYRVIYLTLQPQASFIYSWIPNVHLQAWLWNAAVFRVLVIFLSVHWLPCSVFWVSFTQLPSKSVSFTLSLGSRSVLLTLQLDLPRGFWTYSRILKCWNVFSDLPKINFLFKNKVIFLILFWCLPTIMLISSLYVL